MGTSEKKSATGKVEKSPHRAPSFSASHKSVHRQAINGNTPIDMLNTLQILASKLPTWMEHSDEEIVGFHHDVIVAYIQAIKSPRITVY